MTRFPEDDIALAVSGGPDSLALLLLARREPHGRIHVLTVDHRLRLESAAEARHVAAVCAQLGVPHATLGWDGAKPSANLQAAAREARYALMRDWCADHGIRWLATAHHADDQAETLLLRLARGAGAGGLGGIRAQRDLGRGVTLLRPLLDRRRADLAALVADAGLTAIDDSTNRDPRYDRTAARALLHDTLWLDPDRLAASASHLADADAALDWTADAAWRAASLSPIDVRLDVDDLPAELQRRLLLRAFAHLGAAIPDGPALERLRQKLTDGGRATLGGVLADAKRGAWHLRHAPPRKGGAGIAEPPPRLMLHR